MKRFLPVLLALAFSAFAVVTTLLLVQRRAEVVRVAGKVRHDLGEVIEEITEPREGDR